MIPPNHIKFDFLGKDSIKYENTVEVHPKVSPLELEHANPQLSALC